MIDAFPESPRKKFTAHDTVRTAMMTSLIAVCSWISIPSAVPFTLQTFAVFCSILLIGGQRSLLAITAYLLAGAVGVPVFAGFTGGISRLFDSTGGYMIGFIFTALIYWASEKLPVRNTAISVSAMLIGLAAMYLSGTVWFILIYTGESGAITITKALKWCVIPFIIPDLIKLSLSFMITKRLRKHITMHRIN